MSESPQTPKDRRQRNRAFLAECQSFIATPKPKLAQFHRAISWGDLDTARTLATELAIEEPEFLESQDTRCNTPLLLAAYHHKPALVLWLLELSANVHARAANGDTPLHAVAFTGDRELMTALLDHGADIEAEATDGRRPIHLAIASGYKRAFNLLLSRGARFDPTEELSVQAAKIGKYVKRER